MVVFSQPTLHGHYRGQSNVEKVKRESEFQSSSKIILVIRNKYLDSRYDLDILPFTIQFSFISAHAKGLGNII